MQAAFDAIAFMSKRVGRWRGEVDSVHGPHEALFLIGSASATFMMSRGTPVQLPINRTNTRLQPISAMGFKEVRIQGACEGSPYMDTTRSSFEPQRDYITTRRIVPISRGG